MIEVDGEDGGVDESLATIATLHGIGVFLQGHTRPTRQNLDGIREVDRLGVLDETEQVAALAAPEAVIETAGGVDAHRGRLLLVEGADRHHGPTGATHLRDFRYQLDEIGEVPHPFDVFPPVCHPRRVYRGHPYLRQGVVSDQRMEKPR